jgi:hypothetical protein
VLFFLCCATLFTILPTKVEHTGKMGLVDTTSDKPAKPRKLFVKERDHVLIITSNS